MEDQTEQNYLIFTVDELCYAASGRDIAKVIELGPVRPVPRSPAAIRGLIRVDGRFIPLCDLRQSLGFVSLEDELFHLQRQLQVVREDHIAWVDTVKKAVYDNHPLVVEENPHKCRFGRWYDDFYSSNFDITAYMARFAKPHQKIHRLAHEVRVLLEAGKREEALTLIQQRENKELSALLELIDNVEVNCRRFVFEYAIVVDHPEYGIKAVSIDSFADFRTVQEKQVDDRFLEEQEFVDGAVSTEIDGRSKDILRFSFDRYFAMLERVGA